MPFVRGHKSTGGRPKGSPNKISLDVRQEFYAVFEGMANDMSGREAFRQWARRHPTQFYTLLCRVIPAEIKINHNHESFLDRMAKDILVESQLQVVDIKQVTTNPIKNPENPTNIRDVQNGPVRRPDGNGHARPCTNINDIPVNDS